MNLSVRCSSTPWCSLVHSTGDLEDSWGPFAWWGCITDTLFETLRSSEHFECSQDFTNSLYMFLKGYRIAKDIIQIGDRAFISEWVQHLLHTRLESCWSVFLPTHITHPNAVTCLESSAINPWSYAFPWSRILNHECPPRVSVRSWIRGSGCLSGTVFLFSNL